MTHVKTKRFVVRGVAFSGTSAAHCPARVRSVGVAIAQIKHQKCSFLVRPHLWTIIGACRPAVYLRATGTYRWSFRLKMVFPAGTYWVWQRAVDDHRVSTRNTPTRHLTFTLVEHR